MAYASWLLALAWVFSGSVVAADSLQVQISRQPEPVTQDAHAVFEFSAPTANEFKCAVDGNNFQTCSSPLVLLDLPLGQHTLQVKAVDIFAISGEPVAVDWQVTSVFNGHSDLLPTAQLPSPVAPNSWKGIFRINCDFAHASYDDPLVYPGQPYAAHYHKFFGSTFVNYNTTIESLYAIEAEPNEASSSCQGNTLNRSAYWYPSVLAPSFDTAGNRLLDNAGNPAWQPIQAVVGNNDVAHEIFYYSAGIDDISAVQPIPVGLSMIAGTASTGPDETQAADIIRWHCQTWASDDASNPVFSGEIPECFAPDRLRADIFFPSCWNGNDLDSADHKSHMAYPVNSGGRGVKVCPESHPVPIARVSYHLAFPVKPENYDPQSRSSRGWRLASDMYEVTDSVRGGRSLHADWMNGWHPEVMLAIVENCIRAGLDCHDGNLANGTRLSGVAAGSQTLPAVINEGMGPSHSEKVEPMTTLWRDRAHEEYGLDIRKIGDDYVVFVLSYDDQSEPTWYLASGTMKGNLLALHAQGFDYQVTRYPPQRPVASTGALITIDFDAPAESAVCQDGVDRADAYDLAVFSFYLKGAEEQRCIEPWFSAPAPANDFTGTWVPLDWLDGGWGLSVWQQQPKMGVESAIVVYFYDAEGNGRWVHSNEEWTDSREFLAASLLQFEPGSATAKSVGEIELGLLDSENHTSGVNTASIEIFYAGKNGGEWLRSGTPIFRLLGGNN
jgi:hypothetical protein